jgi:hypothetical protein
MVPVGRREKKRIGKALWAEEAGNGTRIEMRSTTKEVKTKSADVPEPTSN